MLPEFRFIVTSLLSSRRLALRFVDVGSRNGLLELRDIAPFVDAHGFEPNPAEYERLLAGTTDQDQRYGYREPPYRTLEYHELALSNFRGTDTFYLTPSAGAAGLLEPNLGRLEEIIYYGGAPRKESFGADIFEGWEEVTVAVTTLDAFCAERDLGHIDYLSIDVEGSEYEVLEGGSHMLSSTGVIKVETCFLPFRRGQKIFSHLDLLLRDFGLELLRYQISQDQIGYKERHGPWMYHPDQMPDRWGQPLQADGIYVNRRIENPDRALAQAAVLVEKGYLDEACHILRTRAAIDDARLLERLRTYVGGTRGQRWRARGYALVDRLVDRGSRILRWIGL